MFARLKRESHPRTTIGKRCMLFPNKAIIYALIQTSREKALKCPPEIDKTGHFCCFMWKWILFFNLRLNPITLFELLSLKSKSIKYQWDGWSRVPRPPAEHLHRCPARAPVWTCDPLWSQRQIHTPSCPSASRQPRPYAAQPGPIAVRLLLSCWTTDGATQTSGRAIDKHISGDVAEGDSQSLGPSKYEPMTVGFQSSQYLRISVFIVVCRHKFENKKQTNQPKWMKIKLKKSYWKARKKLVEVAFVTKWDVTALC